MLHDSAILFLGWCIQKFIYIHLTAETGFLSRYLNGPLPYVWRHITITKNVVSASLNKTFPSFATFLLSSCLDVYIRWDGYPNDRVCFDLLSQEVWPSEQAQIITQIRNHLETDARSATLHTHVWVFPKKYVHSLNRSCGKTEQH